MTWRPEPRCPCGQPVPSTGPSLDYCTAECQYHYLAVGFDREPVPARSEWRRSPRVGVCDCGPREVCNQCGPGFQPMTDPEARQWFEATDPDPAPGGGDRLTYGTRGLR